VVRDPIEETNTLLVGTEGPASGARLRAAIPALPRGIREVARQSAARLGQRLDGGTVYTDDRAPVEWLIDRSILGYAADD